MQLIQKDIKIGCARKESFKVWFISDLHAGAKGFSEEKLKKDVAEIKADPNSYWIGGGDMAECINTKDKRFDLHSLADRFAHCLDNLAEMQTRYVVELLKPIKDKCWGMLRGNHERHLLGTAEFDMTANICHRLGVTNLQDSAFIIIRAEIVAKGSTGHARLYKIYCTHGNVGGRKSGGKANRLEDLMSYFDADIYMIGHGHKKIAHTSSQISPAKMDNDWILKCHKKVGFMSGSYLKSYELEARGYCEQMMLPPSDIGAVYVEINPRASENKDREEITVHI